MIGINITLDTPIASILLWTISDRIVKDLYTWCLLEKKLLPALQYDCFINGVKADPDYMIYDGDRVQFVQRLVTQHITPMIDGEIYHYKAYRENDGGFTAIVQDLPGCMTCADTWDELSEMVEDAIKAWLEVAKERE